MAWVRARQLQLLLTQIDRLPDADRTAICARIHPGDAIEIQSAAALDWIPMKLSADLARAVTLTLGRDRARTFFKDQFAVTLSNAVLGSLVAAVSRHLSSDPRPGLRWMPRGHDLLFRGVGRLVVTVSPDRPEAILSLVDLPPELAADPIWLDRYAWSAASMQLMWRTPIDCELVDSSPDQRFARFRMWWTEPPRPR
jgi:hypothetical protein